mmetsp:Transcript_72847/g.189147  ORF Transcript_72847/g.189147 Transcript_72847/m.189147 type:complete len:417 (-) Transcript_72847:6-1256(-)
MRALATLGSIVLLSPALDDRLQADRHTILPLTAILLAALIRENALALLLAIAPLALEHAPIWPNEHPLPVAQAHPKAALVPGAARPIHAALAVHVALAPLSHVQPPIIELELAFSIHEVLLELALKRYGVNRRSIRPSPVLHTIVELTLIPRAKADLDAASAFLVLTPLAFIAGAVGVRVLPLSVGLIVAPLALVPCALWRGVDALSMREAVDEAALIAGAVRPGEDATAVPTGAFPLALVPRAALHELSDDLQGLHLLPDHLAGPAPHVVGAGLLATSDRAALRRTLGRVLRGQQAAATAATTLQLDVHRNHLPAARLRRLQVELDLVPALQALRLHLVAEVAVPNVLGMQEGVRLAAAHRHEPELLIDVPSVHHSPLLRHRSCASLRRGSPAGTHLCPAGLAAAPRRALQEVRL